MNHVKFTSSTPITARLTDEGLAQLGTLAIVTASLMAIVIFML
jgi:hypothetical protein